MSAPVKRPCAVCGESQARKKVWEKRGHSVICFACAGRGWTFDVAGVPHRKMWWEKQAEELQRQAV